MDIRDQVMSYLALFPEEKEKLKELIQQVEQNKPSIFNRTTLPGHITASGLVMNNDKVLLVFHPYLQKWIQPGGHVDEGEIPMESALREVLEETGIKAVVDDWHMENPVPFDIDVHKIPANEKKNEPEHNHYDFRYLLRVDNSTSFENELSFSWKKTSEINDISLNNLVCKTKILK